MESGGATTPRNQSTTRRHKSSPFGSLNPNLFVACDKQTSDARQRLPTTNRPNPDPAPHQPPRRRLSLRRSERGIRHRGRPPEDRGQGARRCGRLAPSLLAPAPEARLVQLPAGVVALGPPPELRRGEIMVVHP